MSLTSPTTLQNPRKRIFPLISKKLVIQGPVDFHLKKRIKRCMALTEKETYRKVYLPRKGVSSLHMTTRKHARELNLRFGVSKQNLKMVFRFLKFQPNIKRLYLSFSERLGPKAWKSLGKMLTKFSRLTHISFGSEFVVFTVKDEILLNISLTLRKLPHLQEKTFQFTGKNSFIIPLDLTNFGFHFNADAPTLSNSLQEQNYERQFPRLSWLRNFRFSIQTPNVFTVDALERLEMITATLTRLEKCVLNLRAYYISESKINSFLDVLAELPYLKEVELGFQVSENTPDSPLCHNLWKSPILKKVIFDLEFSFAAGPEAMNYAIECVGKIKSLYAFSINLMKSVCGDDDSIERLGKTLLKLPNVKRLSLDMTDCKSISNKGVLTFLILASKFGKLEDLRLNFTHCTLASTPGDPGAPEKYQGFSKLRKLNLILNSCEGFMKSLSVGVTNMLQVSKKLENLNLDLNGCENISCQLLKEIIRDIFQLNKMDSLSIELGDYGGKKISEEQNLGNHAMEVLGDYLSKMNNLKSVTINAQNCRGITEQGNIALCERLVYNYHLHTISLKLNCSLDRIPEQLSKALRDLDRDDSYRYMVEVALYGSVTCSQKIVHGI